MSLCHEEEHTDSYAYVEVIYTDIHVYTHTHTHYIHTVKYIFNILVCYLEFYTYNTQFHTKELYYNIYLTYMYPILEYSSVYLILEYYA
jgi:hypothetical protein